MATYDLIGVPLPIKHDAFANDVNIKAKIRQLENYIEIQHDLRNAKNQAAEISLLETKKDDLYQLNINVHAVVEALASSSVVLYAKCFSDSQGRTKLEASKVFTDTETLNNHKTFTDIFRSKLFAHHELEANRHQIFVFPSLNGAIRLNPSGQTNRIVASTWIAWEAFGHCIEICMIHVQDRISGLCRSIETNLTPEQVSAIQNTPREELFNDHWRMNERENNPLSIRAKT